jgi:hypothetical protein
MNYEMIDELVSNTISKIFESKDLATLSDDDKAQAIYKYLTTTTSYDFPLLEQRKKRGPVNLLREMMNVFVNHTGICSALSQAYKLLLEKVGIGAKAVIVNDGNPVLHQLLIIKNKVEDNWYISDVTRGILYKEEGMDNFAYGLDRCEAINQRLLGFLPDSLYDAVFGKKVKRNEDFTKLNEFSLLDLPNNIMQNSKVK